MNVTPTTANVFEVAALIGARQWITDVDYIAEPTNYTEWTWAAEEYITRAINEN